MVNKRTFEVMTSAVPRRTLSVLGSLYETTEYQVNHDRRYTTDYC